MSRYYTISDIAGLIGVPSHAGSAGHLYLHCPCCGNGTGRKTFNINYVKNKFHCPRCGVGGKSALTLIMLYSGLSQEKAYEAMCKYVNDSQPALVSSRPTAQWRNPQEEAEPILADLETRNKTYAALLESLTLTQFHRTQLLRRGLTDTEINSLGYKSMPIGGKLYQIPADLLQHGHVLEGVPGFFKTKSGKWTLISASEGILIPVKDGDGLIQGLKIRRDNVTEGKFRWISSIGRQCGAAPSTWVHVSGKPESFAILTEGPMKGDITYTLSGIPVIAVAGVNSLTELRKTLISLKANGLKYLLVAFDMDTLANIHVHRALDKLLQLLTELELEYWRCLWDSAYKGIDDCIWEGIYHKSRSEEECGLKAKIRYAIIPAQLYETEE